MTTDEQAMAEAKQAVEKYSKRLRQLRDIARFEAVKAILQGKSKEEAVTVVTAALIKRERGQK